MIGLVGAHRVGKTTLAKAYAEKHGIKFLETPVSKVFEELGHKPSDKFDFKTRLDIQEVILERLDDLYGSLPPTVQAITDRTPIDMLGYTVAEAIGGTVSEKDQERFRQYVQNCFNVLNKRFSVVVIVQPGIAVVKAEGKAALNDAYIEHLSALMFGYMMDERNRVPHYYVRRSMTDLDERVAALENAIGKTAYSFKQEALMYQANGGMFH